MAEYNGLGMMNNPTPNRDNIYQPKAPNWDNSQEDEIKDYFGDWEDVQNYRVQDKLSERQQEYQKELMDLQYWNQIGLNQQGFNNSMKMFDYTAKNADKFKMETLKELGLNPALMYGNAGSGGSSNVSSGGSAAGGNARQMQETGASRKANSIQEKLGMLQIGLQMQQISSQARMNDAEANKANAEAERISGTQTELDKANIDNIIAKTTSERERAEMIKVQTRVEASVENVNINNAEYTKKQTEKAESEIRHLTAIISGIGIDNQFKAATFKTRMQDVQTTVAQKIAEIQNLKTGSAVNDQQVKNLQEQIDQNWTRVLTEKFGSATDLKNIELKKNEIEIMAAKIGRELNLNEENQVYKETEQITDLVGLMGIISLGYSKLLGNKKTEIKGFK